MILDKATRSLTIVLGEAKVTNEVNVVARTKNRVKEQEFYAVEIAKTNGMSAVTIVAPPADNTAKIVEEVIVYNNDTIAHEIQIAYVSELGSYQLLDTLLGARQTLMYTPAKGWMLSFESGIFAPLNSPSFSGTVTLPDGSTIGPGWTVPAGSIPITGTDLLSLLATDGHFLERKAGALVSVDAQTAVLDLMASNQPYYTLAQGAVTKVSGNGAGLGAGYFAIPAGKTLTFGVTGFVGAFDIQVTGGQAATVRASYAAATANIIVTEIGSTRFAATATPTTSQVGIFKSANSQVISVKNGLTASLNMYISIINDNPSVVTDPV